jgi:hypothetical protein
MYACRYNGESMKYLLKHPEIDNDMLYKYHLEYGSCLTLASRYQPIAAQYLLTWDKLSWKIVNAKENRQTFLSIACKYNSEVVKYAIDSEWDLTDFIIKDNSEYSPFLLPVDISRMLLNIY